MKIVSKPWFIATLALVSMVGTHAIAFKLYWREIFPERPKAFVVKREEPQAFTWGFSAEEISQLQLELQARLAAIEAREKELSVYEKQLEAARGEIDKVKSEVELMRGQLMQDVVKLEADEQKNLKTLAKTYATLTPEAAVSIFSKLDDPTVVKILFFMKTDTVGAILQEMAAGRTANAETIRRAASISNMLRLFTDNSNIEPQPNI